MRAPFEYDLCSFRNVVGQDPDVLDARDEFTLTATRRVLLDMMRAREPDPLVSLEGLLQFWQETREGSGNEWFMMMTISGRFKGEVDSHWHLVPISNRTHSNIPFRLWMERIMHRRVNHQHRTKGWLFQTSTGAQAKFTGDQLQACPRCN
jgi:hypothetical protein